VLPRDTEGLTFEGAQIMSASHPLWRLKLTNCRIPLDALVGDLDQGFKL
jgi:alkylation response protein AidB-like acyl-CoA dehydrogenase